jgi:hypothetical protein
MKGPDKGDDKPSNAGGVSSAVLEALSHEDDEPSDSNDIDMLGVVGVPRKYEISDEYLLPGDLDRIKFDITKPSGYDTAMVDDFYENVYNTLNHLLDIIRKRDSDVNKCDKFINRLAVDLHNSKLSDEMSEGLTVLPGQPSTSEAELQQANLRIIKLQEELKAYKSTGTPRNTGDSKFDDIQNQVSILQAKNRQLTSENKRLRLHGAADVESNLSPNIDPIDDELEPDDMSMPLPDFDEVEDMAMKTEGYKNSPKGLENVAKADASVDLDMGPSDKNHHASSLPVPDDMVIPSPEDGSLPQMSMPMPDDQSSDDEELELPLPSVMDDSYEDINFTDGHDDGEIDMSKLV